MTAHEPIFEGGKLVGVLNYVTDYFMLSDPSDKETVLVRAVRDYDPDKSCIPYGGPGADDVLHGIGSERRT